MATKSNIMSLVKRIKTKAVPFNDGEIEVKQLTLLQVNEFSEFAKADDLDSYEKNRESLGLVIRAGVVGLEDITDEDLNDVPIASLKELSDAVLEFNGLKVVNDDAPVDAAGNG